jgi:hypothetical protein
VPFRDSELKHLSDGSDTKEDLQVLYEAIQELGYTEYSVLKLLDRLREYLEELRRISRENEREEFADVRDIRERTKDLQKDLGSHDKARGEELKEISDQIDSLIEEVQDSINRGGHAEALAQIAKHGNILIQASRQVLQQNGYDPDTGVKILQIDQDWQRVKKRIGDFLWSLLTAILISSIFYLHTSWQRQHDEVYQQQIGDIAKQVAQQLDELKQKQAKPGDSGVTNQSQSKSK